jgi:tRNA (cytosine38-C5)-methyltransferase
MNELGPRKLLDLGLRFFSPMEIAKLHGFYSDSTIWHHNFEFPIQLTRQQRYRLLGNSLNVDLVAILLDRLLGEDVPLPS